MADIFSYQDVSDYDSSIPGSGSYFDNHIVNYDLNGSAKSPLELASRTLSRFIQLNIFDAALIFANTFAFSYLTQLPNNASLYLALAVISLTCHGIEVTLCLGLLRRRSARISWKVEPDTNADDHGLSALDSQHSREDSVYGRYASMQKRRALRKVLIAMLLDLPHAVFVGLLFMRLSMENMDQYFTGRGFLHLYAAIIVTSCYSGMLFLGDYKMYREFELEIQSRAKCNVAAEVEVLDSFRDTTEDERNNLAELKSLLLRHVYGGTLPLAFSETRCLRVLRTCRNDISVTAEVVLNYWQKRNENHTEERWREIYRGDLSFANIPCLVRKRLRLYTSEQCYDGDKNQLVVFGDARPRVNNDLVFDSKEMEELRSGCVYLCEYLDHLLDHFSVSRFCVVKLVFAIDCKGAGRKTISILDKLVNVIQQASTPYPHYNETRIVFFNAVASWFTPYAERLSHWEEHHIIPPNLSGCTELFQLISPEVFVSNFSDARTSSDQHIEASNDQESSKVANLVLSGMSNELESNQPLSSYLGPINPLSMFEGVTSVEAALSEETAERLQEVIGDEAFAQQPPEVVGLVNILRVVRLAHNNVEVAVKKLCGIIRFRDEHNVNMINFEIKQKNMSLDKLPDHENHCRAFSSHPYCGVDKQSGKLVHVGFNASNLNLTKCKGWTKQRCLVYFLYLNEYHSILLNSWSNQSAQVLQRIRLLNFAGADSNLLNTIRLRLRPYFSTYNSVRKYFPICDKKFDTIVWGISSLTAQRYGLSNGCLCLRGSDQDMRRLNKAIKSTALPAWMGGSCVYRESTANTFPPFDQFNSLEGAHKSINSNNQSDPAENY